MLPYQFLIPITDNASTDSTPLVAARLSRELSTVRHVRLEQKGRGRALAILHAVYTMPHRTLELTVLVLANLAATVLRFVLLRGWVFGASRSVLTSAGRENGRRL